MKPYSPVWSVVLLEHQMTKVVALENTNNRGGQYTHRHIIYDKHNMYDQVDFLWRIASEFYYSNIYVGMLLFILSLALETLCS